MKVDMPLNKETKLFHLNVDWDVLMPVHTDKIHVYHISFLKEKKLAWYVFDKEKELESC